jgi:hypothetical protein
VSLQKLIDVWAMPDTQGAGHLRPVEDARRGEVHLARERHSVETQISQELQSGDMQEVQ